jgi:hypothetical protein
MEQSKGHSQVLQNHELTETVDHDIREFARFSRTKGLGKWNEHYGDLQMVLS